MFDEHEPAEPEITADLKALEQQLAQIAPMALRIDRDQLMFEAGRASVAQPRRLGYIADPSRVGAKILARCDSDDDRGHRAARHDARVAAAESAPGDSTDAARGCR